MKITEDQAREKANALVALLGCNWEPFVWDNLGWAYCARALDGTFSVYPTSDGTQYHALLGSGSGFTGGGLALWTDDFSHEDPREVVRHQAELALHEAELLMNQAKKADAIRVAMENQS